jgi:hypothetical protein
MGGCVAECSDAGGGTTPKALELCNEVLDRDGAAEAAVPLPDIILAKRA